MNANFQKAIADQQRDDAIEAKSQRSLFKKDRKLTVVRDLALIVGVATFLGVALYNPITQSLRWGQGPSQVTAGAPTSGYVAPQWFQETENRFPVALDAWAKNPYTALDDEELAHAVLTSTDSFAVTLPASVLPSASTGYTDIAGFAFNSDGSKNPLYSLWTQENFSASLIVAVERIINPTFGDWATESRTNNLDAIEAKLGDLFTGDFLLSDASLPVVTDSTPISSFTMGDGLPSNGTGWIGVVAGAWSIQFDYDPTAQNYVATVEVPVVYSIWRHDRTIITADARLHMTIVPNHDAKGQTDRVLIDTATLIFGG